MLEIRECLHCGAALQAYSNSSFCCMGCSVAYSIIHKLELNKYYEYCREVYGRNPVRTITVENMLNYQEFIVMNKETCQLNLLVEGVRCGACVWLIENTLKKQKGIIDARLNLSTHRLAIEWYGVKEDVKEIVEVLNGLGYRAVPFFSEVAHSQNQMHQKYLLKCLTVAAACSMQVMMLAFAIWAGVIYGTIGTHTASLLNLLIATISIPAIAYSGMPFFKSAINAVLNKRSNMDVPISIGVLATTLISINQNILGQAYTYYDAAIGLILVLLIGRYLDLRVRNSVTNTLHNLIIKQPTAVTIFEKNQYRLISIQEARVGQIAYVAAGEKVAIDGIVLEGESEIDNSVITGESLPIKVYVGSEVFAGSINLSSTLKVRITGVGDSTTLSEIARLIEISSQLKSKYVMIADKVASYYTPAVFSAAVLTFLLWKLAFALSTSQAALYAVSVLIVTCPCALGLAAPIVQVVSVLVLMKKGILVKTSDALEKMSTVTDIVFDKTGTLTHGAPFWLNSDQFSLQTMRLIASIASRSKHHIMKAIAKNCDQIELLDIQVEEIRGMGLLAYFEGEEIRLGSRAWCAIESFEEREDDYLEVWFCYRGKNHRLIFQDTVREEALDVVQKLQKQGYVLHLFSGDREVVVETIARQVGIEDYYGLLKPADKYNRIRELQLQSRRVLMVGDGLNDSPSLKLADASIAPGNALEVALNNADLVFQNDLYSIIDALKLSKRSVRVMKQNFILSFIYNIAAVPIAMLGLVTPLFAAVTMACSSVTVVLNAVRLNLNKK